MESRLGQASTVSGGEKASVQEGRKCGGEDQRALAKVLGMPSKDLAVAIASAVRQYVLALASLSSVAAKEWTGSSGAGEGKSWRPLGGEYKGYKIYWSGRRSFQWD